jgi:hypothetical protein
LTALDGRIKPASCHKAAPVSFVPNVEVLEGLLAPNLLSLLSTLLPDLGSLPLFSAIARFFAELSGASKVEIAMLNSPVEWEAETGTAAPAPQP